MIVKLVAITDLFQPLPYSSDDVKGESLFTMTVVYFKVSASVTSVNTTNFVVGENAILFCNVSGFPYPSVSWINVTSMETVYNGAIWRLPNISRNNHGMYNCRANNTCNVDNKMVNIVVQCKSKCIL